MLLLTLDIRSIDSFGMSAHRAAICRIERVSFFILRRPRIGHDER